MGGLTLPFSQTLAATDTTFEINITSGGGTAIQANSFGTDQFDDSGWGINAETDVGVAIQGTATTGSAIVGQATTGYAGLFGGTVTVNNDNGQAITATSQTEDAVNGTSAAPQHAGVSANSTSPSGFGLFASSAGAAIYARGNPAAYLDGDVQITGVLTMTGPNSDIVMADCAEDFDVGLCTNVEPGTVMALNGHGLLEESRNPYDKKVAGVISGAGDFKSGMILGRTKAHGEYRRAPVALVGKVYCKVCAQDAPIEIGDLLTTSEIPGHAMKAEDPLRAFGAVIGKALQSMSAGQRGLIPILVALQ